MTLFLLEGMQLQVSCPVYQVPGNTSEITLVQVSDLSFTSSRRRNFSDLRGLSNQGFKGTFFGGVPLTSKGGFRTENSKHVQCIWLPQQRNLTDSLLDKQSASHRGRIRERTPLYSSCQHSSAKEACTACKSRTRPIRAIGKNLNRAVRRLPRIDERLIPEKERLHHLPTKLKIPSIHPKCF
jgi:hypothetical protein